MAQKKKFVDGPNVDSTPSSIPPTGFTLVELLVVIGIIALLISILLPALSRAKESGNQIKCMANLRTIGEAIFMYAGDNKGVLPIGQAATGSVIGPAGLTYTADTVDWTTLVAFELNKNAGMFFTDAQAGKFNLQTRSFFICPTAPQSEVGDHILSDYSSHPRLMPNLATTDASTTFTPPFITGYLSPYKLAHIKHSTDIMLIFDSSVWNEAGNGFWTAHDVCNGLDNGSLNSLRAMTDNYTSALVQGGTPVSLASGNGTGYAPKYFNTDTNQNLSNIRFRHAANKKANGLMCDGHVQAFTCNALTQTSDLLQRNISVNK